MRDSYSAQQLSHTRNTLYLLHSRVETLKSHFRDTSCPGRYLPPSVLSDYLAERCHVHYKVSPMTDMCQLMQWDIERQLEPYFAERQDKHVENENWESVMYAIGTLEEVLAYIEETVKDWDEWVEELGMGKGKRTTEEVRQMDWVEYICWTFSN